MKDICNFLFEIGMLKRTPRTGLQFLGSGKESVAEHCFRVIIIGYTLAKLNTQVDENKVLKMTLLHDILESQTGDLNYVNKKYLKVDEEKAVNELDKPSVWGRNSRLCSRNFTRKKQKRRSLPMTLTSWNLLLCSRNMVIWGINILRIGLHLPSSVFVLPQARELAETILSTDSAEWWFKDKSDWWIWGK